MLKKNVEPIEFDMYSKVYKRFGKLLFNQQEELLFISKKWSNCDLVWPFSDLDFRIIVKDKTIDFLKVNTYVYEVQKHLILKDERLKRILEHPPGYIFKYNELKENCFEDVNNWSFCYGNYKKYIKIKIKNRHSNLSKQYYLNIINKRYKKFSLKNDYKNFNPKTNKKYNLYCSLWHYYFPCEYAINSLSNFKPEKYKINFRLIESGLLKKLYYDIIKDTKNYEEKYELNNVVKEIDLRLEKKLQRCHINLLEKQERYDRYFEAVAMLRTRISRYLLYLDTELKYDRDYLINREINELRFIFAEIYSKNKSKIIKVVYEYVISDNKPRNILEYTLKYLNQNNKYFNSLMNLISEE